jgi:hypothetical protein
MLSEFDSDKVDRAAASDKTYFTRALPRLRLSALLGVPLGGS